MDDRITVNMGAVDLVVEPALFDPRKLTLSIGDRGAGGFVVGPDEAANFIAAAKAQFFGNSNGAVWWLSRTWWSRALKPRFA